MNRKSNRYRRGGRKAFTLLEILLVVGLLALLASFALPALFSSGEQAKKDMARAAIGPSGPLAGAIKMFKFHTNEYPKELKYLMEKPSETEVAEKWAGPYLEDASGLKDPWGHDFEYNAEGRHNEGKFDLWSRGQDGKDGTEDDICNWKTDR
jgi:general secretion pathway protein G